MFQANVMKEIKRTSLTSIRDLYNAADFITVLSLFSKRFRARVFDLSSMSEYITFVNVVN